MKIACYGHAMDENGIIFIMNAMFAEDVQVISVTDAGVSSRISALGPRFRVFGCADDIQKINAVQNRLKSTSDANGMQFVEN